MGYKFQFITLAGFHSLNYSMFELAHGYARNNMSAFVELQQKEFAAAEKGFNRGEAPARGRHRLLRRDHAGRHGGPRLPPLRCTARRRMSNSSMTRKKRSWPPCERERQGHPVHQRRAYLRGTFARAILEGFDKHYRLFREASVRARALFERAAWAQMRELARERIQMYDLAGAGGGRGLLDRYPEAELDESLWPAIKLRLHRPAA